MNKYVGWDIEIAVDIPEGATDWRQHAPLGITCGAAASSSDVLHHWFAANADNEPEARAMTRSVCQKMVMDLQSLVDGGYTLVTWNGLAFDFPVLAMESGMHQACADLALNHVDMMFHVVCQKGFGVGLDNVAQTMGLSGKTDGMSGKLAPQMWRDGDFYDVLEYVLQDARTTVEVAERCESQHRMRWITRQGKRRSMGLASYWLPVLEASKLPEPDTSWMGDNSLWQRNRFLEWTGVKV